MVNIAASIDDDSNNIDRDRIESISATLASEEVLMKEWNKSADERWNNA